MLREIGEVHFAIGKPVVAPEPIAHETGDDCIDQRITLLRRHKVLHRVHATLTINDRLIEQTIEASS